MSAAIVTQPLHSCPAQAQVRAIVEQAIWSPSGDNCQPWTFESHADLLLIFHDAERSRHTLNVDGVASMLSLGTLLESIRIASSAYGYNTTTEFVLPLTIESKSCWAKLRFNPVATSTHALSSVLTQRSTDRRLFNGGHLHEQMLKHALASTDLKLAHVNWCRGVPPQLLEFIVSAEQLVVEHPLILPKVLDWTRFSKNQVETKRDGLSCINLGVKRHEIPLLLLLRKFPRLMPLFRSEMRRQHRARVKAQLESSAGLVCVSARLDSPEAVTEAGALMMRAWLELNKNQFGVQPLTLSSMSVYLAAQKKTYTACGDDWNKLFVNGEGLLRETFNIPNGFVPLWMIRTGASPELHHEVRTRRLPVDEVLKFV